MTTPAPGSDQPPAGFGEVPVADGYTGPPQWGVPPDPAVSGGVGSPGTPPYAAPPQYPGPPQYPAPPQYSSPPPYGMPTVPPPGYGPYGCPPYGYPPPYAYGPQWAQQAGTNGMAIASMVLGILWIYWVGSVLALIFGYVARSQLKRRPQQGGGMAVAGIVLGWIGVAVLIIVIVVAVSVNNDDTINALVMSRW